MSIPAVAFDLGGSHATCAIVRDARVLAARTLDLDARDGLAPRLPEFAAAVRELSAASGVRLGDCAGCAMALPCVVEPGTNRVLRTFGKYDDSLTLDLSGWSRTEFGLPLATENDARVALLGEQFAGAARGFDDAVMLTLGTGIGGGAMIGGRLVTSKHALAGANGGHFPINLNGRRCICGGIGCAETEAATWSLPLVVEDFAGRFPESARNSALLSAGTMNFRRVFDAARAGDALATAVRDHCVKAWATIAVVNAQAYDAEVIVLGGGVMAVGEEILGPVRAHVAAYAFAPWGTITVRAAELGNEAALVGAGPLLRSSKMTNDEFPTSDFGLRTSDFLRHSSFVIRHFPMFPLLLKGFLLGWSVAWPPGPINAEMLRRGLTRGFWPALSVGIGACAADFLWAMLVALGAGALLSGVPAFRPVFGAVSVTLLLFLAWTFAKGARRDWQRRGKPTHVEPAGRFDSSRGGLLLGLAAALTSPWNLAFWLAVMGSQAGGERLGIGASVILAVGVMTGAMTWGILVCGTLRLGAARRFAAPGWQAFTQGATAALMLAFAARAVWKLFAAG